VQVGDLVQLSELYRENTPEHRMTEDLLDTGVGLVTASESDGSGGLIIEVYWHRGQSEWLMWDELEKIEK